MTTNADRVLRRPAITPSGPARALAGLGLMLALAAPLAGQASDGSIMERALESRSKGADESPIVVFEIADFQCPYCRQFTREVMPELEREFIDAGRVQWVFVNLPLHTHRRSWVAAEAALCAGGVGDKFWPMHDQLYANQDEWSNAADPLPVFVRYARTLGVPEDAFRACVIRDQVATLILQDVTSVVGAQITGTPTFIVMRGEQVLQRVVGMRSVADWKTLLGDALTADNGGS